MKYRKLAEEMLSSALQVSKRPLQKHTSEISHGEVAVLNYLTYQENHITSGTIKDALGVGTGRMADTLKSLEKKGYVIRIQDSMDKRKVFVDITESGKKVANVKREECLNHMELMLSQLGEQDATEFVRIMKRLIHIHHE